MPYARHLSLQTLDFLIGDTGELAREDALLVMAAAMTADGHAKETENILRWIITQDVAIAKVRAAIEQTQLFCGFPRMLNALFALQSAAQTESVACDGGEIDADLAGLSEAALAERGLELWKQVYADNAARVLEKTEGASAEAARWSLAHAYGRVLSRETLSPLQRELCVVAGLIPMDVQPQLKGHVMGAQHLGASADQLWMLLSLVRKLLDAEKLLDQTQSTFESALGKKDTGLSLEEERKYTW